MTASSPSFLRLARQSFWLLFGGIWLFAGIMMLIFGIVFALREQEFAANGAVATGIVLEKQIIPAEFGLQHRISGRLPLHDERRQDDRGERWRRPERLGEPRRTGPDRGPLPVQPA